MVDYRAWFWILVGVSIAIWWLRGAGEGGVGDFTSAYDNVFEQGKQIRARMERLSELQTAKAVNLKAVRDLIEDPRYGRDDLTGEEALKYEREFDAAVLDLKVTLTEERLKLEELKSISDSRLTLIEAVADKAAGLPPEHRMRGETIVKYLTSSNLRLRRGVTEHQQYNQVLLKLADELGHGEFDADRQLKMQEDLKSIHETFYKMEEDLIKTRQEYERLLKDTD
jgi:hypothetical protein